MCPCVTPTPQTVSPSDARRRRDTSWRRALRGGPTGVACLLVFEPIAKPVPCLYGLASGPMFAPERLQAREDSLSQDYGIYLTHCPV